MEQPSFMFRSDKLEVKAEGENFFVEGYISTSDLDQVGDIVTKACLLDMAEQMKNRTIKFDVEHESFRGKSNLDREINKTKIPVAKTDDFLMDKTGIKVRAMLNPFSSRFNEVKGSIDGGFLDAFSIAYVPVKSVIQDKGGKKIRLLDKINLLNVAFTGNPVNTEAKMTNVFAKSLEFLEEKEKGPGGHKPDKTGPHGRGDGPGEGRADGSGVEDEDDEEDEDKKKKKPSKKNIHKSDKLNLKEVKKMGDEEETKEEESTESTEETEEETKDEEGEEFKEEGSDDEAEAEDAEVKALTEKVDAMGKELVEIKALLKKPMRKSKVGVEDKSENFVEEKSQNPLDLIA